MTWWPAEAGSPWLWAQVFSILAFGFLAGILTQVRWRALQQTFLVACLLASALIGWRHGLVFGVLVGIAGAVAVPFLGLLAGPGYRFHSAEMEIRAALGLPRAGGVSGERQRELNCYAAAQVARELEKTTGFRPLSRKAIQTQHD